MSTTPWEKDEKKEYDFSKMNITSTEKSINKEAGPVPNAMVFDEVGHMPRLFSLPTSELQYEVKKYPDGSQYVVVGPGSELTFRLNDYTDLWTLNQINDALVKQKRTCSLCIPNILEGQADRRFAPNQSTGLKLVCQFLNSMKGFYQIQIFHPHNPEVIEALLDKVNIIDNYHFINQVLEHITDDGDYSSKEDFESKMVLMSSDAGGFKPLMKLADILKWQGETYSASKSRKYEKGHSKLIQLVDRQDFGGKDILIVDDICIYGGTFKGLATLLKEKNCGKLYLAVSHMTIENLGEDAVTDYFDKVFTTNSKFDEYFCLKNDKMGPPLKTKCLNLEIIDLF